MGDIAKEARHRNKSLPTRPQLTNRNTFSELEIITENENDEIRSSRVKNPTRHFSIVTSNLLKDSKINSSKLDTSKVYKISNSFETQNLLNRGRVSAANYLGNNNHNTANTCNSKSQIASSGYNSRVFSQQSSTIDSINAQNVINQNKRPYFRSNSARNSLAKNIISLNRQNTNPNLQTARSHQNHGPVIGPMSRCNYTRYSSFQSENAIKLEQYMQSMKYGNFFTASDRNSHTSYSISNRLSMLNFFNSSQRNSKASCSTNDQVTNPGVLTRSSQANSMNLLSPRTTTVDLDHHSHLLVRKSKFRIVCGALNYLCLCCNKDCAWYIYYISMVLLVIFLIVLHVVDHLI